VELLKLIPSFWGSPGTNWDQRDFGTNLLFFVLAPLTPGPQPIFPYTSMAFLGLILGIDLTTPPMPKARLTKYFLATLVMFGIGLVLGILKMAAAVNTYKLDEFLMTSAGSLLILLLLYYLVEIRGKGAEFATKTTFFRRFGMLTLTLWALQWTMIFPVMWFDLLFFQGRAMTGQLSGYELLAMLLPIMVMWWILLRLWEKKDFVGSFEWITTKLLSKKRPDAGQRLIMANSLYDVSSPISTGQTYYGKGTVTFLIVLFFLYALLFTLISLFA
jgi:hypothetical protein